MFAKNCKIVSHSNLRDLYKYAREASKRLQSSFNSSQGRIENAFDKLRFPGVDVFQNVGTKVAFTVSIHEMHRWMNKLSNSTTFIYVLVVFITSHECDSITVERKIGEVCHYRKIQTCS